ncbi:MAG: ion transporter [Flavobacteriaceae bacterium]|nr:ion transporter [Flavobacteriaceae bacterium]
MIQTKHLELFSTYLIFTSSVLIGVQTYEFGSPTVRDVFHGLEYFITLLFSIEFYLRLKKLRLSQRHMETKKVDQKYRYLNTTEEIRWLTFDGLILLGSILGTFIIHLGYSELIFIARLIRIFRLLRLISINKELKTISHKIFQTTQTVFVFGFLIAIILFIYAVVGMFLFDQQHLGILDFSSLHHAFFSLMAVLIDGYNEAYIEIRDFQGLTQWISIPYFISYAFVLVLVTLNVFIAVMTSQVWEKLQVKETIEKEIDESEENLLQKVNETQQMILNKLEALERQIKK